MNEITALIVEDEIENVELLKILLKKNCSSDLTVIAVADSSEEFANAYFEYRPDIIFLDIDLGEEENSFSVLNEIMELKSEIIIISSHDEFAIKAINSYKVSGYLVKPIKTHELVNTVTIAIDAVKKKRVLHETNKSNTDSLINTQNPGLISISSTNTIDFVKISEILYLEADGKYTIFYLQDGTSKMASTNIGEYEGHLVSNHFFRIHHKYIINLKMMVSINKAAGNYCEMTNKKMLPIAKRRYEKLRSILK